MRQYVGVRRAAVSVLIATLVSVSPLLFPATTFLWVPGAFLGMPFGVIPALGPRRFRFGMNLVAFSLVLYFGSAVYSWGQATAKRNTPRAAKVVCIVWLILLVPWLLLAPLSGMAFDAGQSAEAYTFFWSVLTYPVTVGVTAVVRRWRPWLVLLPVLNVAGCCGSALLHRDKISPNANSVTVIGANAVSRAHASIAV